MTAKTAPAMHWADYDAALFDLDGVITPTAEVHMRAWATMFSDFFAAHDVPEPYTERDYFDHVDGKPRYEGVRSLLRSRGIELPEGDPSDGPDEETVCGLGNRKNVVFAQVLQDEGVTAYPGSVRLLDALASGDTRVAIVSSSANARAVLTAAGLIDRFEVIVDGAVSRSQGLKGKPEPQTYEYAADQLGVAHRLCVVFEDAISGVQAGAAGDFGLVVGVDRGAGAQELRRNGADIVVTDLAELVEASEVRR